MPWMEMNMLICPKCGNGLSAIEKTMKCQAGHSYDLASAGYVNLLLSGKPSDSIGDSKEMIAARRRFLDAGYYAPLAEAVCNKARELRAGRSPFRVLDAGCGEGYYTGAAAQSLVDAEVLGIDISRHGCLSAAKRDKQSLYVTASASAMPVENGWADLLLSIFAPAFSLEFRRVLAAGGCVLQVVPGENHLIELKQAVYRQAYLNKEDKHALEGFALFSRERVRYMADMEDPAHIRQLFAMTPYFFRTPKEGMARLEALERIRVTLDFLILVFR